MTAAESATETERPNKVDITDVGPARKKIKISIPAETVTEKLRDSLETLSVEAELPGFRKGKAPRGLVERKFGTAVRDEARKQLIASAYTQAIEDSKLQVVGEPHSETLEQVKVEDGKALEFEVEVEVMPDFELPPLTGLEVKRPTLEVTDEMVDDELRKLCINEGRLESRDEPEAGDYLTGHGIMVGPVEADGKKTEKEHYNIKGAVVQVPGAESGGKGMILGVAVEDFAKQLGLPKPGETATIKVKGPEHHELEAIRNADLKITFTVDRVDRIIPADLEDVVARYGFENEEALREAVRMRLRQRIMVQQQTVMRQQVAAYLLEKVDFELPERLTARQTTRVIERQRLELMYRGMEPDKIEERMAELRGSSSEIAQRELKLFFILTKAADKMDIGVNEGEINGRIAQMAHERNVRPEALRQELIQRGQVGGIFQQIREHKTFDAILGTASVTDVPAEEFNKLMAEAVAGRGEEGESSGGKKGKKKKSEEEPEAAEAAAEEKPKKPRKKKGD